MLKKLLSLFVIPVCLLVLIAACTTDSFAAQTKRTLTFSPREVSSVTINLDNGEIFVEEKNVTEVTVAITYHDDEKKFETSVSRKDKTLHINIKEKKKLISWLTSRVKSTKISIVVTIPKHSITTLHTQLGNGLVDLTDVSSKITANLGNGKTLCKNASGETHVDIGNGSFEFTTNTLPNNKPQTISASIGNGDATITLPHNAHVHNSKKDKHMMIRFSSDFPHTESREKADYIVSINLGAGAITIQK